MREWGAASESERVRENELIRFSVAGQEPFVVAGQLQREKEGGGKEKEAD